MAARSLLLAVLFVSCVPQSLASFWDCAPCEEVDCPRLFCDESVQVLDPICGCCPMCTRRQFQRCGGEEGLQCRDGLMCQYRLGNVFGEDRTGMCESVYCKNKVCGYRQYCNTTLVDGAYNTTCQCPEFYALPDRERGKIYCHNKYRPVCGNDGVTYNSRCHLHRHECLTNTFVGIDHEGRCKNYTVDEGFTDIGTALQWSILQHNRAIPQQEPVPPIGPSRSCVYYEQVYKPNTINSIPGDPCRYIVCNAYNVLSIVPVPGCPGHPPELTEEYGYDLQPINGGWSEWSKWTTCVGGCYNSTQIRYRTCTNPSPLNEGKFCRGVAKVTRRCIPDRCNATCNYTPWSQWSECSASCIGGVTYRVRTITNVQDEEVTRKVCHLYEEKSCNVGRNCPVTTGKCKLRVLGSNKESLDHWYFQLYLPRQKFLAHCHTVNKYEVHYCGGECEGNNGTDCCKPVKWRYQWVQDIECGLWALLLSDAPVVTRCECVKQGGGVPKPVVRFRPWGPW